MQYNNYEYHLLLPSLDKKERKNIQSTQIMVRPKWKKLLENIRRKRKKNNDKKSLSLTCMTT